MLEPQRTSLPKDANSLFQKDYLVGCMNGWTDWWMDGLMDRCMSTQIDRLSAEHQGSGPWAAGLVRCVEVWCIASSLYSSRCSHWGNVITYITVMPTCSARDGTDYSQMSLYRPTDQLSESRQTHLSLTYSIQFWHKHTFYILVVTILCILA